MRAVFLLVLAGACGFEHGRLDNAGDADGGSDATSAAPLHLTGGEYIYDTDTGALTDPNGAVVVHTTSVDTTPDPDLRIMSVTDLVIDQTATLYARGTLPLAIVASGTITVAGAIDVGARAATPGAGGLTSCANGAGDGINDGGGASGGGGGAFADDGGIGGKGDANGGSCNGGAAGQRATLPIDLRGGCPGGAGGDGPDPGGTAGGAGGGVLVRANRLVVTGFVRAGGGGGGAGEWITSGNGDGGGGGGGAGGMIILDAPTIDLDGSTIVANGGAGGGGSADVGPATPGQNGQDMRAAAVGGSGSGTTSADGANGGFGGSTNGKTPTEFFNGAGGGGGGSVGFIVIHGSPTGIASFSPDPQ